MSYCKSKLKLIWSEYTEPYTNELKSIDSIDNLKEINDFWLRKIWGNEFQQGRERKGRVDKYFEVAEGGVVTIGKFCRNEDKGLW